MAKRLAINGGPKTIKKEFPGWPIWGKSEIKQLEEVVRSGVWGIGGTKLSEFAKRFARFQHSKFALPVANGTIAIDMALEVLGIRAGDEVIVPDYTFMATAVAPIRRGIVPVLVDVSPDTFCIKPELIEEALTDKTKAIIPVHFGGHPCNMERIMDIATRYGLYVIEDCAHAHGAIIDKRYVGNFGEIGTFSLQSSKTLCCGEGGVIVTNSERLYKRLHSLHNAGRSYSGADDYNHYICGSNYRMGEFQGGILLAQMDRLEELCNRRERNGKKLNELLGAIEGIRPQSRDVNVQRHGYYLYTFILEADISRDKFREALRAEGVPVQSEYPAIHTIECIKKKKLHNGYFPVSEELAEKSIWLYHHVLLGSEEQLELVGEAIKKILKNRDELM